MTRRALALRTAARAAFRTTSGTGACVLVAVVLPTLDRMIGA